MKVIVCLCACLLPFLHILSSPGQMENVCEEKIPPTPVNDLTEISGVDGNVFVIHHDTGVTGNFVDGNLMMVISSWTGP